MKRHYFRDDDPLCAKDALYLQKVRSKSSVAISVLPLHAHYRRNFRLLYTPPIDAHARPHSDGGRERKVSLQARQSSVSLSMRMAGKMSETSVKIEARCRDDTVRILKLRHCEVELRVFATPSLHLRFWGCGRLLHALNFTSQCLLVSSLYTYIGRACALHMRAGNPEGGRDLLGHETTRGG